MESHLVLLILVLVLPLLSFPSTAQDFDFFYFVQQWPGSFCDTQQSCCYPSTGKPPADFGIHGLWPNYNDGSYPSNCDSGNPFDSSKINDLRRSMQTKWPSLACPSSNGDSFWAHEWNKHGTCSEAVFDEHEYFQAALSLKGQADILGALTSAGINPDGSSYSLSSIKQAIKNAIGYTPWIECNSNGHGSQLYQVYLCVDASGSNLIECSVLPSSGKCSSQVQFPSF